MGYSTCTYIGRSGVCGVRCLDDRIIIRCAIHRIRYSLTLCRGCRIRGTNSDSGYCASIESKCRWKAQRFTLLARKKSEEVDDYISDILTWDWLHHIDKETIII